MGNKKVLITGGAGFIGSHTADALAKRGYKIRILDNLAPPVHTGKWPKYVLKKGYELIRGDVREKGAWQKALKGVRYVYHLAAYQDQRLDFSTFFNTNTVSTAFLYECIIEKKLPVKKIILASSQFVYGDGEYRCPRTGKIFSPELRPLTQFREKQWDILCPHGKPAKYLWLRESQRAIPTNSYGLSKLALENIGLRLGKTHSLPTVVLRYSIVQGPRQSPMNLYSGALRIFVSQALAGVPITVYEDGEQTRDFVSIKDVVRVNTTVLNNPKADFRIFNVGGGKAYKILDFARLVKKSTSSLSPIVLGGFRRTDTRHAVSDISELQRLGWRPHFTIRDSIEAYARWFREEGFERRLNRNELIKLKKGIPR